MSMTEKEFITLPDDKFNQMMAGWAGLCWHISKKKVVLYCDDDRMPDREGYYCEKCGQWFQENPDFRHSPEGLKIMLEWCKDKIKDFRIAVAFRKWFVGFYDTKTGMLDSYGLDGYKDLNPALAIVIGKSKGEIK